jgi:hypothetical protein
MVQVEILERRERSVLVQITFPDGRVWKNTIGNGAMNGNLPKDWMLQKISKEMAPFISIADDDQGSDGYTINAFEIKPVNDGENIAVYWVGDDLDENQRYTVPRGIAKRLKNRVGAHTVVSSMKTQVVSSSPLCENLVSEFNLTETTQFNRRQALICLLREEINSNIEFSAYKGKDGVAVGRDPIVKSGPFNLFRKYNWTVREWNNHLVLQANTSTQIRSDQTLADFLSKGEDLESGKQFIDISSGKRCFFRSLTNSKVSDPIDDEFFKGKSLNQFHSESLDNAPDDLPVVKVAYKETDEIGKYPHHPCLLLEVCDPAAIPSVHNNKFREHRYLNVTARMEHAFMVRNALSDSSTFCSISEHLVKPENLGIKVNDVVEGLKNIEFGNGVRTGFSAREIFSGFSQGGAAVKIDSDISVGFIPCKNGSQRWNEMCNQLEHYIQTNSKSAVFSQLETWDPSQRVPRGKMMEHSELDLVVVEIPEVDHEYENWKRACAQAGVEVQVVTSAKVSDNFAWLNVGFGMIGKLGGAAFKLTGLKTDIDAWIGLDVSRRFGVNMGASSIVMSGDGSPVGWLDQMPMNREKFEDHEIRKILRDTYDGYTVATGTRPKHICVLRDGWWFAGSRAIEQIESELGVKVTVVSIIKRGNFRLGHRKSGEIFAPKQGIVLFDKDGTGYIQATSPRNGSPQLFKAEIAHGDVSNEDLYHDLYWLTNSHIGSSLQIGVPSPVHFAHVISNMFRRNLLKNPDGFSTKLSFL